MAEAKKTTSTRKTTTTKSSTAKTTAAKKTTTTKSTATKATAAKTTKTAASKLSIAEREKKEALRKEVLEHYTRQQNYRATTPSYMQPPVYTYEPEVEEYTEEYAEGYEEEFAPIPTSEQYFQERQPMPNSVYTRSEATMVAEPRAYEPEARAYTPREPLEPTSISSNPKITSLNARKKDPYRRERIMDGIKSFFAQDGLFYLFGFVALIVVVVIMLG